MGLGKRSEKHLYPDGNLRGSEDIKRTEFLEDTGIEGISLLFCERKIGMMMGFGKRSQDRRNAFLEDTGRLYLVNSRRKSCILKE